MPRNLILLLVLFLSFQACDTAKIIADDPDFSLAPGVVVTHSPSASGIYLGSAGIAVLPDGAYLTKCDEFGPGTTEHEFAVSRVYRSDDQGTTWRQTARINGLFWANVFVHEEVAYLMGTTRHHGLIVIMRSDDGGFTWTEPTDEQHGLLTTSGEYHTAPMPIIEHDGKLWRAFEDASGGTSWGSRYQAMMMSIPLDADLLDKSNWTFSNPLPRDASWLNGTFGGWLEGNAVVTPEDEIVNILRVASDKGGKGAVVHVSEDGKTVSFDPENDFIDLPGGSKKVLIRYDVQTDAYWALANPVLPKHAAEAKASSIRNTLALMRSDDLRTWEIRCVLIYHPEVRHHGFQYPDWLFEGDDIIAAIRTAYDDGLDGAHNAHDANFLTFHRFEDFRELTLEDSVIDPSDLEPIPLTKFETSGLTIEGRGFTIKPFDDEALAYGNRTYVWRNVPKMFRGWSYTQTNGGEHGEMIVTAQESRTLFIAATQASIEIYSDWDLTEQGFTYTDHNQTPMRILKRNVEAGASVSLPQQFWAGTLLLIPPEEK
jgi:hypothetical protein